ncbi:MAG: hypothetical protein L0Z50_28180 [Verrucomicrobiales bacterium]|nr:hypothetical protein [Verrucomicrobiales bacterium]
MSDSGHPDYHAFQFGHAVSPLHKSDNVPAELNVSGSIKNFAVSLPKQATMKASVSGGSITGRVMSQNASVSGDTSAAAVGVPQTGAASTTSQAALQAREQIQNTTTASVEEDEQKRKRSMPVLAKATGRVTVILPPAR